MHMTLNWCFPRVLIDAIGFNRCFIISSFNLATLQQFWKKRQNRRYYHFKFQLKNKLSSIFFFNPTGLSVVNPEQMFILSFVLLPTIMNKISHVKRKFGGIDNSLKTLACQKKTNLIKIRSLFIMLSRSDFRSLT